MPGSGKHQSGCWPKQPMAMRKSTSSCMLTTVWLGCWSESDMKRGLPFWRELVPSLIYLLKAVLEINWYDCLHQSLSMCIAHRHGTLASPPHQFVQSGLASWILTALFLDSRAPDVACHWGWGVLASCTAYARLAWSVRKTSNSRAAFK